jgi:hypothetical protein
MERNQWVLETVLKTVNSLQVNQAFESLSLRNKKGELLKRLRELLAKQQGVKASSVRI